MKASLGTPNFRIMLDRTHNLTWYRDLAKSRNSCPVALSSDIFMCLYNNDDDDNSNINNNNNSIVIIIIMILRNNSQLLFFEI